MNLEKLFGDTAFEKIICLPLGSGKSTILLNYMNSGSYWIEDNVKNALDGESIGLKPVLMEHGYNMDYEGPIPLVKNWQEVYELIVS